jgi:hypothetical protein
VVWPYKACSSGVSFHSPSSRNTNSAAWLPNLILGKNKLKIPEVRLNSRDPGGRLYCISYFIVFSVHVFQGLRIQSRAECWRFWPTSQQSSFILETSFRELLEREA